MEHDILHSGTVEMPLEQYDLMMEHIYDLKQKLESAVTTANKLNDTLAMLADILQAEAEENAKDNYPFSIATVSIERLNTELELELDLEKIQAIENSAEAKERGQKIRDGYTERANARREEMKQELLEEIRKEGLEGT